MKAVECCVGIDLGSTTTKAVLVARDGAVIGRGITNSRSSYRVACEVAVAEAGIDARLTQVSRALADSGLTGEERRRTVEELTARFRGEQYRDGLATLTAAIARPAEGRASPATAALRTALEVMEELRAEVPALFAAGVERRSDFFRDLAGGRYMRLAERLARERGASFDQVAGVFDRAILEVENAPPADEAFDGLLERALRAMPIRPVGLSGAVAAASAYRIDRVGSVGTGYGRATLPFPREQIRSEILCHGLGAHHMFPLTRTVLDIGGQDTKAIQVDADGIVTSFQMNDRCAAGCGRYLGYIADEMNLAVQDLGPIACTSSRPVRINSTCTVFAGAELRERLGMGEAREDILAGLHRAIILRAMSLIARSGGISDQFTFTGGVARNPAAVAALEKLVAENYGKITMNISFDSIYTGALGAALFAWRAADASAAAAVTA